MTESSTLYRKYRPRRFSEMVGQKALTQALLNAVAHARFGQAYIFAGPRGTGKTSLARILAAAVNCSSPKGGEPCGKCPSCQAVLRGNFIDLIEIDAASYRGIDNIRELTEKIHLAPTTGKYKVYIIDEAHMLTREAFNALLKTLEEPPSHVLFILATTEPYKLPQTILSRCQRFDFGLITLNEITDYLVKVAKAEKLNFKKDILSLLAKQARGSLRDALSLLEQVSYFQELDEGAIRQLFGLVGESFLGELMEKVLAGELKEALALVNQLYDQGYDPLRFVESWANYLRGLLFIKLGAIRLLHLSDEELAVGGEQAKRLSLDRLQSLLSQALEAGSRLKRTEFPLLPLELLMVEAIQGEENSGEEKDNRPPSLSSSQTAPSDKGAQKRSEGDSTKKWQEAVALVQKRKPALAVVIKQAEVRLKEGKIELAFASHFCQQLTEKTPNREFLEQALASSGMEGKLSLVYDRNSQPTLQNQELINIMNKEGELLGEVYKLFGKELS